MLAEAIGLKPVSIDQVTCPPGRPVNLNLLSLVSVATKLDVGLNLETPGWRKCRPQTDHPASRIAVEHRIGSPDDLHATGRAKIEVCRLRGTVRGGERDTVLKHLDASHPKSDHRCPNRGLHPPCETKVSPVFSKQTGNPAQRLGQSLLALSELDFVTLDNGNCSRDGASVLEGTGYRYRFGEWQNFKRDIQRRCATRNDRDHHCFGPKARHQCNNLVGASPHSKEFKAALLVAYSTGGHIRYRIRYRHGCTGDNRSSFVKNRSSNGALTSLTFSDRHGYSNDERQQHGHSEHTVTSYTS